jgi:HptB-dependent secretion and biofilm anti anti-sigma factor
MTIELTEASADAPMQLAIVGRFDSQLRHDFMRLQTPLRGRCEALVVDLARTNYMDSTALGMLLMLRESLGGDSADITLRNCGPEIAKILQIANFQTLFAID